MNADAMRDVPTVCARLDEIATLGEQLGRALRTLVDDVTVVLPALRQQSARERTQAVAGLVGFDLGLIARLAALSGSVSEVSRLLRTTDNPEAWLRAQLDGLERSI
jgi:hypothetical protein